MSTSECWLEIMPNQHKPFDFFGWSWIACFSYSLSTSKHLEKSIYEKDLSVFYLFPHYTEKLLADISLRTVTKLLFPFSISMGNTPNMVATNQYGATHNKPQLWVLAKLLPSYSIISHVPGGNYHSWTKKSRPSENTDRQALGKFLRKLVADQ